MEAEVQATLTKLSEALEVSREAARSARGEIVTAGGALNRALNATDAALAAADQVNGWAVTLAHQVGDLVRPVADPHAMPSAASVPAGWRRKMGEDFSTSIPKGTARSALGAKGWAFYDVDQRDTSKRGVYDTVLSVLAADGELQVKWGHKGSAAPYTPYGAALLPLGWDGALYGRFSIRFKLDKVTGRKVAYMLWPKSNIWNEGEIDFPEAGAGDGIWGFNHQLGAPSKNQMWVDTGASSGEWHTAVIEWRPERVTFLLDGVVVKETTDRAAIPKTPMRWVLQHESNLDGKPMPTSADGIGYAHIQWVTFDELVAA